MALVEFRKEGIFVPEADVYIDPSKRVQRALITHGHSDHARKGHRQYICAEDSKAILRIRLGNVSISTVRYGETFSVRGVKFTFFPAGHIVGSAQIRIERKGEIWVVSGDYKLEDDSISGKFEAVRCHTFVTETTFGLPIYTWRPQQEIFEQINRWWSRNRAQNITSLITAYSLGKAQRLLAGIDASIGPLYTDQSIDQMNRAIRGTGVELPPSLPLTEDTRKGNLDGGLIVAANSFLQSNLVSRFGQLSVGAASGWMQVKNTRMRSGVHRRFVLSDHVDWDGLNQAVRETGAERIYAMHGYTRSVAKWFSGLGYESFAVKSKPAGETTVAMTSEEQQSYE